MMNEYKTIAEIEEALYSLEDDENPRLQIDLLEQAIIKADELKLEKQAYEFRERLIQIANFSGYNLKGIVAFGHNIKYVDQYPDRVDLEDFFWDYRCVIESSCSFYQVPLSKIEEMTADLKKRLLINGYDLTSYYDLRYKLAYKLGHMEDLIKFYELKTRNPEYDACEPCDLGMTVDFLGATEGYDAAALAAKDIFSGEKKCESVPEVPFCNLLATALEEGKYAEAAELRRILKPLIEGDEYSVGDFGNFMFLYLIEGEAGEALSLFKKYYRYSLNPTNTGRNFFEFTLGAYLLFDTLTRQDPAQEVILPFEVKEISQASTPVATRLLSEHFKGQVYEVAKNFDERNQNQMYGKTLSIYEKALQNS